MSEPYPPTPSTPPDSGQHVERRVEVLADEYLERLLAGETPDRQAILNAHPDLADLLEPRLALVELMHRVARAEKQAENETTNQPPPAVPAERALRVTCPHCGNGIQLVEPVAGEVTCNGCGSSFKVDPQATTSHHPAGMPGTIGKFAVLEQLGRGAFGTVYKARDPELDRLVAVKVPRAGSFATAEEEERFLREARAAAQLSHPGIVPVLEIAHDGGVPYIVSEYVEGLTLADVLTGRRPAFRESAELVAAVAEALDYAHRRKIVHRDVKPSNLPIDHTDAPHVTDFGLARRGEGEITVTLDGQILGTPAYMAPEQAAGDQQRVDARSDVYGLGVVLYELLAGELPFRGNQRMLLHQVLNDEPKPPRSLNDRLPRDLETICLKAMAKVQGKRYGSAMEMANDLRRFLNGEPIRARRVGRTEKVARWARRNPVIAGLTAALLLTLVSGLLVSSLLASSALNRAKENRLLADKLEDDLVKSEFRTTVLGFSNRTDMRYLAWFGAYTRHLHDDALLAMHRRRLSMFLRYDHRFAEDPYGLNDAQAAWRDGGLLASESPKSLTALKPIYLDGWPSVLMLDQTRTIGCGPLTDVPNGLTKIWSALDDLPLSPILSDGLWQDPDGSSIRKRSFTVGFSNTNVEVWYRSPDAGKDSGVTAIWNHSALDLDDVDLLRITELLACHRIHNSELVPISQDEARVWWERLKGKYPGIFTVPIDDCLAWHLREDEPSLTKKHRHAALFAANADCLSRPDMPHNFVIRARLLIIMGEWSKARADFARAWALGGTGYVRAECRRLGRDALTSAKSPGLERITYEAALHKAEIAAAYLPQIGPHGWARLLARKQLGLQADDKDTLTLLTLAWGTPLAR